MNDPDDRIDPAAAGEAGHEPVMLEAVLSLLAPAPGETALDATVGRGGHAQAIAPRLGAAGRYVALDLDRDNVAFVRRRLEGMSVEAHVRHADFAEAPEVLASLEIGAVDLVLADLGFASSQMDDPERGLSFAAEGPLDMRLNRDQRRTAADLLARLPEAELADLFWRYGEERLSRKIARKIVERRRSKPIKTTRELADLCTAAYGPRGRRQRIHPATRAFMALRIAVNQELERLETLLEAIPELISPGGRALVISFHSLEDRAVKRAFRGYAEAGRAELLTRKPLTPTEAERASNPRSRSAKLRALRWLGTAAEDNTAASDKDGPMRHPRMA